jgi:purine-nucleoside phosphorylase
MRVMQLLGIDTVILTNAAGGLNPTFAAGDLMLITDHIALAAMTGDNPLHGPNDDRFGPRFPDMTFAYDRGLQQLARDAAGALGNALHEGVYVWLTGPNFETPAEIRMLHALGADAVGMSTVPSVIVARHMGVRVLGISTITNVAPHQPEPDHETTHDEVIETGAIVVPRLRALLLEILKRL